MVTTKESGSEIHSKENPSKLYRSEKDKIFGGVCGGLGKFFSVDSTLVRLIFVLLFIFGGSGLLLYIILWIVIPTESSVNDLSEENIKRNVDEIRDRAKNFAGNIKGGVSNNGSRVLFAYIVVGLGLIFLLSNFGLFDWFRFGKLWPLILVAIGVAMLLRRDRD